MVITRHITVETKGNSDIIDISFDCEEIVGGSGMSSGIVTVFNPGSTGGLSTLEFEPNLVSDIRESLEIFAPSEKRYHHEDTWHDDNGSAHVRSFMVGPSITVPFVDSKLSLGTWQQIVFCDFDTRPRTRKLVVQVIGE